MDMHIITTSKRPDGIFGEIHRGLVAGSLGWFGHTLEHAFLQKKEDTFSYWEPVIPRGVIYTCKRGKHTLDNGKDIESFEVMGVKGHWGIIFHPLNYNRQSKACIGLGDEIVPGEDGWWIKDSGITFNAFMALQSDVQEFLLEVV